jgi:Rha family phage regulatory protein
LINKLVTIKNDKPVTSSLQVAKIFDKNHRDVLKAVDDLKKGVAQNFADLFYEGQYTHPQNKQKYRIFYMTKDGFSLLAMGFSGKKAIKFKLEYIDAFNKMEQQIQNGGFNVPTSMSEALRLAADQQDRIEQMKPKVLFANAVETSDSSILVGELAKLISQNGVDIGAGRLFKWMRSNGYLISGNRSDRNLPTQKSMDLKIFEIKERTYNNPDGSVRVTRTPKVTGKGQTYFVNKFLKGIQ